MDERKRFDDLVTECTWTVMQGITVGAQLSALVRNVMSATIEWKNDLDADSPKRGLLDQMRRLNDVLNAERDKLTKENEQLKAHLAEKSAEVMKFAGDVVRLEAEVKELKGVSEGLREAPMVIQTQMGSIIREIADARDKLYNRANELDKQLAQAQADHGVTTVELEQANVTIGQLNAMRTKAESERDEALRLKDRYSARLAVYVKAVGQLNLQLNAGKAIDQGE